MTAPLRAILGLTLAATILAVVPATTADADDQPYQFPVRPGTAAWAALPNYDAMLQATQVPPAILGGLTTDQLVGTVLAYPMLRDILAFDNVQSGVDRLAGGFNGLAALLRRPDAGRSLLARYSATDVRLPTGLSRAETGDYAYAVWAIETLLAQPQVLAGLTSPDQEALLRAGQRAFATKQATGYGEVGLEPTTVLLGRGLAAVEGWDFRASELLRDATAPPKSSLATVLLAVEQHFVEPDVDHQLGGDVSTMDHPDFVSTPRGTRVAVRYIVGDLPPFVEESNHRYVATNYPNATVVEKATKRYNCHSYAFHSQQAGNSYWMNTPGDDTYWNDGSYTLWQDQTSYPANMRWSWASDDHSGVEVGTSGTIRSKWGHLPLMEHRWDYSPYNASVINKYFLSA